MSITGVTTNLDQIMMRSGAIRWHGAKDNNLQERWNFTYEIQSIVHSFLPSQISHTALDTFQRRHKYRLNLYTAQICNNHCAAVFFFQELGDSQ